jgi:hypothetical protein
LAAISELIGIGGNKIQATERLKEFTLFIRFLLIGLERIRSKNKFLRGLKVIAE